MFIELSKGKKKHARRFAVRFFAIAIVAWLCLRLFAPLLAGAVYSLGDDLAEYKRTLFVGWTADEPFSVFPEKTVVQSAKSYHYDFYSEQFPILFLLYDNDALAVLQCEYTAEDYSTEIARLDDLCGERNETAFFLPGYVYFTEHRGDFLEYALIDEEKQAIYYLAIQNRSFAKQHVSPEMLPLSWQKR